MLRIIDASLSPLVPPSHLTPVPAQATAYLPLQEVMQRDALSDTGTTGTPGLRMGAPEWGLLVLHSVLWGSAFFFIAIAKTELPAMTITTLRLVPAAAILLTVVWLSGLRMPATWAVWRRFLILAALNTFIPFVLIVYAQREVTGGVAAVFNATTPVFALFMAHAWTHDEKLSLNKLAGVLLGVAGVAILVWPDLAGGSRSGMLAKIALIGSAVCYAAAGIFSRTLAGFPAMVIASGQMIGAFFVGLPFVLLIDQPWTLPAPSAQALLAILGTGVFASAFASMCYFTLIKRAGATNTLLVTLLLPLTPMALNGMFLGEIMTARELLGALVIGLALVVIDGRLLRRLGGRT